MKPPFEKSIEAYNPSVLFSSYAFFEFEAPKTVFSDVMIFLRFFF
ncbi:hypothetical protein [Hugenholtzia roseola]|nr:hypothetical protein [Hugenholtzia roseola]